MGYGNGAVRGAFCKVMDEHMLTDFALWKILFSMR